MSIALLVLASLASGGLVAHRVFRERDPVLLAGLSPLLGAAFVLMAADVPLHGLPLAAAVAAPAVLLAFVRGPALEAPATTRTGRILLAVLLGLVVLYTLYFQARFPDTDNWVHEPLITSLRLGLFPPVNPFFPNLVRHGHYGRDLLLAAFLPADGDPLAVAWALNPLLQAAAFVTLFGSIRALTGRFAAGILVATMAFFGVCAGSRVGMVDTFDGNNGVVYALLCLCLHLVFRLFRPAGDREDAPPRWAPPAAWIVSGAVLGIYQLVYETHFGLLLLTGATLGVLLPSRRAWAGLLVAAAVALPVAATSGGVVTDLAQRIGHSEVSAVDQNLGQHVTVKFPKEHLFCVLVTEAPYQRTSAAYRTRLFSGLWTLPTGRGYMSIFDPRFLPTHWLPLYLCPFTLVAAWRRRSLPGLGLWAFGAWAYLVPGLVDFGPVYEWEYFRWEFAAGLGLAGALGLALSWWMEPLAEARASFDRASRTLDLRVSLPALGALLLLGACLAAGQKALNGMVIDLQSPGRVPLAAPGRWRTLQPEFATTGADLAAAHWLRQRVVPGERFLSNLTDDTPPGIWPDAVFSALSGALPAGHAAPPLSEDVHAAPPFHADAQARAFWATGNPDLLAGVRWLYVDPARLTPEVEKALAAATTLRPAPEEFVDGPHRRRVYEVLPARRPAPSQPPLEAWVDLPVEADLRVGKRYPVVVTLRNPGPEARDVGLLRARVERADGSGPPECPLDLAVGPVPAGGTVQVEHSLVTPLDEGALAFVLSLPVTAEGAPVELARVPLRVDFLTRLAALRPRLDLPDSFRARRFSKLRLGLTSDTALEAPAGLALFYRFRRPGGEFVWEIDSIPQPLALDLQPGVEQEVFFELLTPEAGDYDLEVGLQDLATGRTLPLGSRVRVAVGD